MVHNGQMRPYITPTLITAITITLSLAACSPSVPAPTAEPTATSTPAPAVTTEPVEPEAPAEPADPTPVYTVGDTVAAEDIEQARAAGLAVYTSPYGDGSGVVLDPNGEAPDVVVKDVAATGVSDKPKDMDSFDQSVADLNKIRAELDKAGMQAAVVARSGSFESDGSLTESLYVIKVIGNGIVPAWKSFKESIGTTAASTPVGAIAKAQPFIDKHNLVVIDATK